MAARSVIARRKRLLALAGALAMLALPGCDEWLTRPSLYNQLGVTVRNQDGTPIPGVPLELYTGVRPMDYGLTDANGWHLFERVPKDEYGVRVQRPLRYSDFVTDADSLYKFKDRIDLPGGVTDTVAFVLARCVGTLSATVLDQAGAPVARAPVRAYTATVVFDTASTGTDGRVVFDDVPCALPVGIQVMTSPLYSVTSGAGADHFDELRFTSGQETDVVFHVRRPP